MVPRQGMDLSYGAGVAYHEDNTTGIGQIYVVCENGNRDIKVYDLNGSIARSITIASNRYYPRDLVLDENGTIYIAEWYAVTCLDNNGSFKWRTGRNALYQVMGHMVLEMVNSTTLTLALHWLGRTKFIHCRLQQSSYTGFG